MCRQAFELFRGNGQRAVLQVCPFFFNSGGKYRWCHFLDDDLDARLVFVVAPAEAVVHAQNRFEVGKQVLARQPVANRVADHRSAPEPTAHADAEAYFTGFVFQCDDADIMHQRCRTVFLGAADRNLEFARQVGKLGVERGPLAQQFAIQPRIDDLIAGDPGEFVGGDITYAIAGGLDRVHLHAREFRQDFGHVFQFRPVELQVLARRKVAVAAVIAFGDVRELA